MCEKIKITQTPETKEAKGMAITDLVIRLGARHSMLTKALGW